MLARRIIPLLILLPILGISCESHETPWLSTAGAADSYDMSNEAYAYLVNALDILQTNFVHRDLVDWEELRARSFQEARGSKTTRETYRAIQVATSLLDDPHTRFLEPEALTAQADDWQPMPNAYSVAERIGYLSLPGCCAQDSASDYAQAAQSAICGLEESSNLCGWIVDLHQNTGGNIWPMLAGVGLILGEGIAGGFETPDGSSSWSYSNGQALADGQVYFEMKGPTCQLKHEYPPIAVIIGPNTMSAGEAIAVAFRGRQDTRSFGQETGGLTTGVSSYPLGDGAEMAVATSLLVDSQGSLYSGQIQPDTFMRVGTGSANERVIQAAVTWLMMQPACADGN